jgi:hypothetical protein
VVGREDPAIHEALRLVIVVVVMIGVVTGGGVRSHDSTSY